MAACRSGPTVKPTDLPAVGGQVSLIRLPTQGGPVEVYNPDSLNTPIWTSRGQLAPVHQVLGIDLDEQVLYLVDAKHAVVAVDLESRGIRTQLSNVEQATFIPDGSIYATVGNKATHFARRTPTVYKSAVPVPLKFLYGTLGDRLIAVSNTNPPKLLILTSDQQVHTGTLAPGQVAATYWGDLLAVAAVDQGLMLYNTADPFASHTIKIHGKAQAVTFSPSGHRIYVARDRPDILVYDRFGLDELATIDLPGPAVNLRTDASGRWLLARPAGGDSVWVIDLTTGTRAATVSTDWQDDLPLVAGASTIVLREDGDVVTRDLTSSTLKRLGKISGGALDLWSATPWLPRERLRAATAAAESASVAQDSLLVPDSSVTAATDSQRLYLQISSSQNSDWSNELAKQLTAAGFPSRVLVPSTADEGYRVVVGPYPTREAAEEVGRKLGRPYFILTNPPIKQ